MDLYYNKQLIKRLYDKGKIEAESNYRYWLIARNHYAGRSGIFSINEFMDVLHANYDFKTLHHGPGNNRTKTRNKLKAQFDRSILFQRLQDGRYKAVAERRLCNPYSLKIKANTDDLKSSRAFLDAILAALLAGNQLKGYEKTAQKAQVTPSRVRYAVSRMEGKGRLIKQNNYILSDMVSDEKSEIQKMRGLLLAVHGIATPKPFYYKRQWHLCLYAANSYQSKDIVSQGIKGQDYLTPYKVKKSCFYRLVDHVRNIGVLEFNRSLYDLDSYIADYGFQHV